MSLIYCQASPDRSNEDSIQVEQEPIQPNAEQRYDVSSSDLPLSCPMPGMSLWNSHPRVYLPIEKTGEAVCPYCGASYILRENKGD
jgi:uncharacterized Zn-finger protein